MKNDFFAKDDGYLRKFGFYKKNREDGSLKKASTLQGIVEDSSNKVASNGKGYHNSCPNLFWALSDEEFKRIKALDEFEHSGCIYQRVKEVLHSDVRVFEFKEKIDGKFKEGGLAIESFFELIKED